MRSALDLLEAQALFDSPERTVHIRTAEQHGHIYLDLADEQWRVVDIGADGWRVIGSPPVHFRRPAGMLPLPIPERGGSIETLRSFLNLPSQNDFVLIVASLLGGIASWWSLPAACDIGRTGLGQDRPLQAAQDPDRSQCRSRAGALARGTRADDCS
jgi:hypothetical protein